MLAWCVVVGLFASAGCARHAPVPARVSVRWLAGHTAPVFDPDGPPDALRQALERVLSRGLVERDANGALQLVAADSVALAPDSLALTLRLRAGLRFTDGTPATSADFATALRAGLGRDDHATVAWLLAAVRGMDRVRAGRPLPALGIETPDERTLVLRLARPDTLLLARLACAGVGVPWRHRTGASWGEAVGLGPYRVVREESGRELLCARADAPGLPRATADTLQVRFVVGAARARTVLRRAEADLLWPLPPAWGTQPEPAGYRAVEWAAAPPRRLLLVLRADVPPTTKMPARHALVHALNHEELLAALGVRAAGGGWLAGAGPFDFPRLDAAETRAWLARGKLGASFHVTLAYDADGPGAEIAHTLQGEWAAQGLYAELRPLRGAAAAAEPLSAAAAQVQLVEAQALLPGAGPELALLVMPLRGPAVGNFRTGWRTRDFDRWLAGGPEPRPAELAALHSRLAGDRIVLPLATYGWRAAQRVEAPAVAFDPASGPRFATPFAVRTPEPKMAR